MSQESELVPSGHLSRLSFGKSFRLRDYDSRRQVMKVPHARVHHDSLLLLARRQDSFQQNPRLGIIVSRKVYKEAVLRNRLRRRIQEWFRLYLPRDQKVDWLVIAKPKTKKNMTPKRKEEELHLVLQNLLGRAFQKLGK